MFLSRIISGYLLVCGVIYKNKYKGTELYVSKYVFSVAFITISGLIYGFFAASEGRYKTLILGLLFCCIFGVSLQCVTKVNSNLILKIISRIKGNMPSFIRPVLINEAENEAEKNLWHWFTLFVLSSAFCLMTPYGYFFIKDEIQYNDPDLHSLPYFFSFFKIDSLKEYIFMIMAQGILGSTCIFSYWLFTLFILYTVSNIKAHCKEMNCMIKHIHNHFLYYLEYRELFESSENKTYGCFVLKFKNIFWTTKFDNIMDKEIIKLIKYHQFIHCYIGDFTKFLSSPFTALFVWFISTNVLFSYALLQLNGNDILFILRNLSLVIHETVALCIFSQVAQIAGEMNKVIMDSFYFSQWYYLSPKIRKNLVFTLLNCQQEYRTKCLGMYVINLNLFVRALRAVYSVLNVLHIMRSREKFL